MIKVKATANGYYGNKIRVPGEEFGIEDMEAFSENWMTKDDVDEPETRRVNTGGTDGIVGEVVPKGKAGAKGSKTIEPGGSDNDDRSRDFASNPGDNAPPPDEGADPDPLDHDTDGRKGGSLKGAESTRSKGKAKADNT